MNDLISRKAAINALERLKDKTAKGEIGSFYNTIIQNDIDAIVKLPSAQQERTGSCCGRASNAKQAKNWNYCPYCGKKMEEMK